MPPVRVCPNVILAVWFAGLGVTARLPGAEDVAGIESYARFALTQRGDAARGERIFREAGRAKCSNCHRVHKAGGEAGPDLTSIGGKFDRPHLIEALLEPSRQIVEGYRPQVLVFRDGRVLTGVVKARGEDSLALFDAAGKQELVAVKEIELRTATDVSLMPEGLAKTLTKQEFTDLITYLETLQTGKVKMGSGVSGPIQLPEGFEVETVATGLTGATALETTSDGRVFICEQTGALRVIRDGRLLPKQLVTLPVEANWERGLIGVTVAPGFPTVPYVYVCYVASHPYPHHVVSRFTVEGDLAVADSELVLLQGDDQAQLGGKVPAGHQGGGFALWRRRLSIRCDWRADSGITGTRSGHLSREDTTDSCRWDDS